MNRINVKLLLATYILIVILTSVYLFTYNRFGISNIGNKTVFVAKNSEFFNNGSLVVIEKEVSEIKKNDTILFYDSYGAKKNILNGKVVSITKTNEKETTFELEDELYLSSSYLIGRVNDAKELYFVGYVVSILSSFIGYFMIIILPILGIFIYEISVIVDNFSRRRKLDAFENN